MIDKMIEELETTNHQIARLNHEAALERYLECPNQKTRQTLERARKKLEIWE